MLLLKKIFSAITNLYFLFFINGFLIATIWYFKIESVYEREIFGAIAQYVTRDSMGKHNADTFFIRSLNLANSFEHNRLGVFGSSNLKGIKANIFRPSTLDLVAGNGSCGSASVILSRILKSYGYVVRFAQMKVNGKYGGHIIIEVKKDKDWIVLDPLYNLYFKDPSGKFASFDMVSKNINYYKKQFPPDYNNEYLFEGVQYTNWNKVKTIGQMVKSILDFLLSKEAADQISIRAYIIRIYEVNFKIGVLLFIPIFMFTVWKFFDEKNLKNKNK